MPLRILVADDEARLRTEIRDILTAQGHEVFEASDGREAESVLAIQQVDLVVLDLVMPVQDGLETITHLKALHPGLRIVASEQPSSLMLLECAALMGAHATLEKPFTAETVAAAVLKAMSDNATIL
jgi:DNA-binding NtrC family response regulator